MRKGSAEEYPKNFALLRLAEKTLAKAKQQQEQQLNQQMSKIKVNPSNTWQHP
jgi:hypothetical protein